MKWRYGVVFSVKYGNDELGRVWYTFGQSVSKGTLLLPVYIPRS